MKLKTKPLLEALNLAGHSLLSNDFIPILSHFCFMDSALYAFNDVSAVFVEHKTGLECALRGDVLLGILETISGDEVEIKPLETSAELNGGKAKLPMLPSTDFIFTLPEDEQYVNVPFSNDIVAALKACLITVGQDALRPEFTGVTVQLSKSSMVFFSSDNATISRYEVPALGRKTASAIFPKSTAQQALDLRAAVVKEDQKKQPELKLGDKYLEIEFNSAPGVFIYSKLLSVEAADFQKVLDMHLKGLALFDIPAEFAAVVKRAELVLGKDLDQCCELATTKTGLTVKAQGQLGEIDEQMKASAGVVRHTTVNPAHISRVLSYCNKMGISEKGALVLVGDVEEGKGKDKKSFRRYISLIESNGPQTQE